MHRRYRLCRRVDFARLRRHGRSLAHPLAVLVVVAQPEVGLPHARFAFSASKRVGNAVKRNRAKRLLREAVRVELPAIGGGYDCLFIARSATPDSGFAEVQTAVRQLLRRAKLIVPLDKPLS